MDNLESEHHGLQAEHGLSFWIQSNQFNMLFDVGGGAATIQNAQQMGLDLSTLPVVVCSHSHYDHCGGFPHLLRHSKVGTLVTGPGFFEPKYSFDGTKYTFLGAPFDHTLLQEQGIAHQVCIGLLQLAEGCYVVGNFNRSHPLEEVPKRFVRQTQQGVKPDLFEDEICLVLQTKKGLAVVVGCSHPGILNILQTVVQQLKQPICTVIGGTHLIEADEERIRHTVSEMQQMGLKLLGLSHCSGEVAERYVSTLTNVMGCHLAVGESILL